MLLHAALLIIRRDILGLTTASNTRREGIVERDDCNGGQDALLVERFRKRVDTRELFRKGRMGERISLLVIVIWCLVLRFAMLSCSPFPCPVDVWLLFLHSIFISWEEFFLFGEEESGENWEQGTLWACRRMGGYSDSSGWYDEWVHLCIIGSVSDR